MKFNISDDCIKNRGLDGCAEFIAIHSIEMIKKTIEREGIGSYEISFEKSKDEA